MPKLGKQRIDTLLRAPEFLMRRRINALGKPPTTTPEQFMKTFMSPLDRKILTDAVPRCGWRPNFYGTRLPTIPLEGSRYKIKINFRLHGEEEDEPPFLPPAHIGIQPDAPDEPLQSIIAYTDNRIAIALEYAKMEAFLKYFVVLCDQDVRIMRYLWPGIVGLDALSQITEHLGEVFAQVLTSRVPRTLPVVCPLVREHIAMATELTTAGLLMPDDAKEYTPPKYRPARGSTNVSYEIDYKGAVTTTFQYPDHINQEYTGRGSAARTSLHSIPTRQINLGPLEL